MTKKKSKENHQLNKVLGWELDITTFDSTFTTSNRLFQLILLSSYNYQYNLFQLLNLLNVTCSGNSMEERLHFVVGNLEKIS